MIPNTLLVEHILPGSVQETVAEVLVIVGVAGTCGGPTGWVVTCTMAGALSRSLPPSMSTMLNAVMDNLRHNRHIGTSLVCVLENIWINVS